MAEITGEDETDPVASVWQTLCRVGAIKMLVGLAILLNLVQIFGFQTERREQQDFAHYYVSSNLWIKGEQVYGVDLTPHYEELGWTEFNEPVEQATNPPSLLAIFAPLASLEPHVAHTAWMLIQILAFVCGAWFSWQCVKGTIGFNGFGLVLAVFMFLPFLKIHFYYSQVQLLLMAMILFAHRMTLAANETESGGHIKGFVSCVLVASAAVIKVYPLVLLPWFVWRSSQRMSGRIVAGVIAAATLIFGVWMTDIELWQNFAEFGLATVSAWVKGSVECFTIGNTLHQFNSVVTGDSSGDFFIRAGSIIGVAILGIFYLSLILQSAKATRSRLNVELALLVVLMLFCGATCWWHYLVFLLFPFQVVASELKERLALSTFVAVLIVVLLFAKIDLPSMNIELLQRMLNQQPFFAMLVMAAFLGFRLKTNEHLTFTDR